MQATIIAGDGRRRESAFLVISTPWSCLLAQVPRSGGNDATSGLEPGVERSDLVDVAGEPLGQGGVFDLEHVLRVALARAREVEAPREDDVVDDRELRVHEVVQRPGAVGSGRLSRDRGRKSLFEQRELPRGVAVLV